MKKKNLKIVVAITGASGSIYARVLLEKLILFKNQIEKVGIIMSENAKLVWEHELGKSLVEKKTKKSGKNIKVDLLRKNPFPFNNDLFSFYSKNDFTAPFASGSAQYQSMIICPCSMGTLGRIASGISDDLTSRAADVILKERRKLILVTRETPLSLIHINNMKTLTEAGATICPASPSFYSRPKDFSALAQTVIDRVLDLTGIVHPTFRWSETNE